MTHTKKIIQDDIKRPASVEKIILTAYNKNERRILKIDDKEYDITDIPNVKIINLDITKLK